MKIHIFADTKKLGGSRGKRGGNPDKARNYRESQCEYYRGYGEGPSGAPFVRGAPIYLTQPFNAYKLPCC